MVSTGTMSPYWKLKATEAEKTMKEYAYTSQTQHVKSVRCCREAKSGGTWKLFSPALTTGCSWVTLVGIVSGNRKKQGKKLNRLKWNRQWLVAEREQSRSYQETDSGRRAYILTWLRQGLWSQIAYLQGFAYLCDTEIFPNLTSPTLTFLQRKWHFGTWRMSWNQPGNGLGE